MRHAPCPESPQASRCHHPAEYGFARGGPVPVEPALLAERSQGWRERGQHRASGGQDARSERPARWHGLAPSLGGWDHRLGGLLVNARRSSEAGSPNGPPSPRLAPGGFYGRGWRMSKSRWHGGMGLSSGGALGDGPPADEDLGEQGEEAGPGMAAGEIEPAEGEAGEGAGQL